MRKRLKFELILYSAAALYIFRRPLINRIKAMAEDWETADAIPLPVGTRVNDPMDLGKKKWKHALLRTKQALKDKDLAASAAALAYYATLSFFPVIIGLSSLYVVVAGHQALLDLIHSLEGLVPQSLYIVLERQLTPIATSSTRVGWALVISVATLLWTSSGGIQNLVRATDKAYDVKETRNIVKLRLVSLVLSTVLIASGIVIMGLLLLQGGALHALGAPAWLAEIFPVLRWPLLIILISLLLSAVYRYAPNRPEPHWQWVSWGATAATFIWLAATVLFFLYVQNFGNYTKTYGTFAGIVVLMIWFNISALIVLLGAQVNKKLEEVSPAPTY
jgi:membrane protein